MTKDKKPDWDGCPTRYAAGIVGDKWCFLILRDVLLHGKRTYSEFLKGPEGISTNILANRLARLEAADMLDRQIDPRKASRVCYFPTRKARDVLPALISIMVWSTKYDPATEAPASFAAGYQADPIAAIDWYEAEIDRIDAEILARFDHGQ
ncbi:helix-turn-helix transcriptional regulator [Epibacterium ulvae]|uniref:winged helix-turn-helix transcriptional regulator n=1 Tax=Epibacterium ulvae TaxID=1156985 RepID=UPI001BFC9048|nr:helix-turn-helix domain-containing protein [Epibacterium ulvae]MBT8152509.1 helix-turn-helix transcriptional regulator [Epibacterium ulvae]